MTHRSILLTALGLALSLCGCDGARSELDASVDAVTVDSGGLPPDVQDIDADPCSGCVDRQCECLFCGLTGCETTTCCHREGDVCVCDIAVVTPSPSCAVGACE